MLVETIVDKNSDIPVDLPLFEGIPAEKIGSVLHCLNAHILEYKRGDIIAHDEEQLYCAGYLLEGSAVGIRYDSCGNRSIIGEYSVGSIIAEHILFDKATTTPFTIVANEGCQLLNFNIDQKVQGCARCMHYANIVRDNATHSLLETNRQLMKRLSMLSNRSTREKLLSYLTEQANVNGSSTFFIPYNRQELADYLYIERSALSRELGRMRREGIITFDRNSFVIHS